MFTGLVEATGKVLSLEILGEQARICLQLPFAHDLAPGDSVATNGCCLTVAEHTETTASFDILMQTLKVTNLGHLKEGSIVNLERALRAGDRLGGHFMQGHVDDTGVITELSVHGQDHKLNIQLPPSISKYCIDKGSLAIDGISLTIAQLKDNTATFWITPHTMEHTHLHACELGKRINLEADMLAKYTEKLLQHR